MKTLPLTVLLHEGPIGRAYLAGMKGAGLRPERILLMVYDHHPGTGKPVGRLLPKSWRLGYARKVQEMSLSFWARQLASRHPLYSAMKEAVGRDLELDDAAFSDLTSQQPLESYSSKVEPVLVSNLRDERLHGPLTNAGAVLFTGGGIVPKQLLALAGVRFLHIHPGLLPTVRGADGLLWSALVRGKVAATCFYMAPGIDTGEIIKSRELPLSQIPANASDGLDDAMLYRALFAFYDPLVRTRVLLDVLQEASTDLDELTCQSQDESEGVTYHFMQPSLRRAALKRVFGR